MSIIEEEQNHESGNISPNTSDNLLAQIQMFMSAEEKARAYPSLSPRPVATPVNKIIAQQMPEKPILKPKPIVANAEALKPIIAPEPQSNNDQSSFNLFKAETQTQTQTQLETSERRAAGQKSARTIGHVICCNGAKVIIASEADNETIKADENWSVGQMISIATKYGRIVALVTEMKTDVGEWRDDKVNAVIILADIVGEVYEGGRGIQFKRGVTRYPQVGAIAHRIRFKDLEIIYDLGDRNSVKIGTLSQNENLSASVSVDDILRRHMAILGTTGVGKSCAVSLVVSKAIEADNNLRVVMLDPHNEFADAFGDKAHNLDQNNLDLPYWLLNYDELEDVIFRSKPHELESDILRELVVMAKQDRQLQMEKAGVNVVNMGTINVDTPVPYRMLDVIRHIDDILGQLEPRFSRLLLRNLRTRIELIENNPRYNFMFGRGGREEDFSKILSNIFRLPAFGKPMSTINLSGLPGEVINCVASVVARLSFDVARASQGAMRVLLVCEEAHRYVPKERELGFWPTRLAISRIAKEGRKYGSAVAIVTQRPGELDPTILSQCSTVFAMRLTNEADQEIIKNALSDSSGSIVSFMSALDNREAIAFGEGVSVPMRLRFDDYDLVKMRAKKGISEKLENVKKADDLSPLSLALAMRGVQEQIKISNNSSEINPEIKPRAPIAQSDPQSPLRQGLVRPSLLKKDVADILSKHAPNNVAQNDSLKTGGFGAANGLRSKKW